LPALFVIAAAATTVRYVPPLNLVIHRFATTALASRFVASAATHHHIDKTTCLSKIIPVGALCVN